MSTITVAGIEAVLNGIIDPCSEAAGNPTGIVDLGLVQNLQVEPQAIPRSQCAQLCVSRSPAA